MDGGREADVRGSDMCLSRVIEDQSQGRDATVSD